MTESRAVAEGIVWLQRHPRPAVARDRDEHLLRLARGARVLHVGAVDSGMLSRRLEARDFLHARLEQCAAECHGIDIDAGGIERLRALGFSNLHVVDVEAERWTVPGGPFDLILAADIIEHLTRPGNLLEGTKPLLTEHGRLVLTTPNAYRIENWMLAAGGRELIHPQHALLYSPATLKASLERHGFRVESFFIYRTRGKATLRAGEGAIRRLGKLSYAALDGMAALVLRSRRGYLADGLGVIAVKAPTPA